MKVFKIAFLAFTIFSQITVYASYAPFVEKTSEEVKIINTHSAVKKTAVINNKISYTREEILQIAEPISEKYNVSLERMMYTIYAESHFMNVQSSCYRSEYSNCDSVGIREESYGIAQFHVSTLSKEKALDPYIAVDEMGRLFAKGEACRWTEYRKKYGCQ